MVAARPPTMRREKTSVTNLTYTTPRRAGNTISATDGTTSWAYGYDALDRLVSAHRNGTLIARYAYDVAGRRMAKQVYSSVSGGTVGFIAFVYRGSNVAYEMNTSSTITWKYVWGLGTDDLVAFEDGAGNHYYAVTDQLGSVRNVKKRSGGWTMALRYQAYGALVDSAGTGVALRYRWTGREWDAELGLYYFRARTYNPTTRRFLQEDPIGYAGGPNLYAYVGGSPLERTDPSGLGPDPARWITGPNICELRCGQRSQTYFDGVPVDGAFAMGLAAIYGVNAADTHIFNDVIASQLNTGKICRLLKCPSSMTFGERRLFVAQLDRLFELSNATGREIAAWIYVDKNGDFRISAYTWGPKNSGVNYSQLPRPRNTIYQFHTHPDVAPGIRGFASASDWDMAHLDPTMGQIVWQRDWVSFRSAGTPNVAFECVPRFANVLLAERCPQ